MHVIGTAGHVDHGKSTLVRALTGIDPDRLKEEKAREMTIDLGFAWLELPGMDAVGIIDVPGHRDFVENMLAGVGGIDAVLFVVAADEGVMPQTREHLAIIDLLRIPTGLIVLAKTDLAPDPDWRELVQLDLSEVTRGTVLQDAPILPVSARLGTGIPELRDAIQNMLAAQPPAPDLGRPRLWVDRVFSVSGFGTVVTGTLLDGRLQVGQEIEVQPGGQRGRVRGLQSHHKTLETAEPGNRVAVNLGGIERREVRRGALLCLPGQVTPTLMTAVRFRHLPDAPRPLRHQAEVKLFCGSAETVARVRLLDAEQLEPGAEGWLQLELRDPLPLAQGDRFILRYPSPGTTIGGGDVVDPAPGRRWRRNRPDVIARLQALSSGDPAELIMQALNTPRTLATLGEATGLDAPTLSSTLQNLGDEVSELPGAYEAIYIGAGALDALLERLSRALADFHRAEPLRPGIRPERLRAVLGLEVSALDALIRAALERGLAQRAPGGGIAQPGYAIRFSRAQQAAIEKLQAAFAAAPYTPPSHKEAAAIVGESVLGALLELGELRQVAPDVLFAPAIYAELVSATREALTADGRVNVKTLRDRFNTSRKYALALLEYLNALGITRRDGDDHVLASGDWARAG